MTVSLDALRLAQRSGSWPVYDDEGIYAGLVYFGGQWSCGECLVDSTGGRSALLRHIAEEHA